jgi:multimeric flavodoxin WrbA
MPLKALILNCTLKYSPEKSHTQALIDKVVKLYGETGVECESIRVTDYKVRFGISSNEGKDDEWPKILEKVKACDILIIGSPIWFGVRSSIAQLVIERLDGTYKEGDIENGQFPLYGKVGAVIVTGNEDGAHDVAANTLFNLSHLGCTIPPNCDTYWVGPAGPGPSYMDANGDRHLYTNKTSRYLVHNTVFFANLLKQNKIPTNLKQLTKDAKKESGDHCNCLRRKT